MKHKVRLCALAILVAALGALAAPASTAVTQLPEAGVFEPGESVGGVELGMTRAEVLRAWGKKHGVCRDCARPTWYFNLKPFEPQGAGVIFRKDRVVHAFTLWRPRGWRTDAGLELGVRSSDVFDAYEGLETEPCRQYAAFVLRGDQAQSVFYSFRGRLWGFGLVRRGLPVCI